MSSAKKKKKKKVFLVYLKSIYLSTYKCLSLSLTLSQIVYEDIILCHSTREEGCGMGGGTMKMAIGELIIARDVAAAINRSAWK
jgi:hypothetical protein